MARRCTICDHPEQAAIDRALVQPGAGYRTVARRFGISKSALFRHRKNHLPALVARGLHAMSRGAPIAGDIVPPSAPHAEDLARQQQEIEARDSGQAIDVVQQLKAINAACLEVLKQARSDGKHSILLRAVDRIARQIELQAKLLGDIQDGQTVNIAIMPEWHGIRQLLTEALRPYPEAGFAVARALRHASL